MADNLTSEAARQLSKLGAKKGGRARANVLTAGERSEIARNAVTARWAKEKPVQSEQVSDMLGEHSESSSIVGKDSPAIPIALFQGKLKIGDSEFLVYVLDNRERVMAQREVVRVLTGKISGNLKSVIGNENLKPFINSEIILGKTVQFSIPGTQMTGIGYEATLLLDICDGFLRARELGILSSRQLELSKQAEIVTRACAKVGIIALIDEATGYGPFKRKQEYQLKLQAFIAEDLQEWAKMFPDEFWFELARLESIHYSPRSRPLRWGKYVMMFVYDAVDPDVGRELRKKNPDPHFLQNHHQWLKQFGRDKVHDQITKVVTIMKLCNDMSDFRKKFARLFSRQLAFDWSFTP